MSYYNPKWLAYSVFITSIVNAFPFPLLGLIFGSVLQEVFQKDEDSFESNGRFWTFMLLADAAGMAIFNFINKAIYGYLGENLTFALRKKLFNAIIYKDPSWFDRKDRAPGILSNILSEDITLLNGLTTEFLALIVEGILILLVGIILSFSFSWRTGLVCIAMSPIVLFGAFMMQRVNIKQRTGVKQKEDEHEDPYA